jgi:hypothetical protein
VSVRIVNLGTNKEEVLCEREDSGYRFAKWFTYKNYEIQLRFNLQEILNGEPMLKADIKDKTTGELIKTSKKSEWHHTPMKHDAQANRKIYDFKFHDLSLRLYIIRKMATSFSGSMTIAEQK